MTVEQMLKQNPTIETELFKNVVLPSNTASDILWNYFYMRNRKRYVMPEYTVEELNRIIITVVTVNAVRISKYWETVAIKYPLVENYNLDETVTTINTPNLTTTQTSNRTQTQTGKGESSTDNNISAESSNNIVNAVTTFENVVSFSDTDKQNNTSSATNTAELNSATQTETMTTDEDTTEILRGGTDTTTVTTNRHGNIGVTTNQQMLTQERELLTFSFINWFMGLVEDFILLHIYE